MVKPVVTPAAMAKLCGRGSRKVILKAAFYSAAKQFGLNGFHWLIRFVLFHSSDFSSLNLAQAVLLMGYEWFKLPREQLSCMMRVQPRGEINAMLPI